MRQKILRFVSKEPTTFLPLLALTYTALALSGPGNSHAQNEAAQPPLSLSGPQGVFAGSETCTSCHEKAHAKWDQSRHSKMVQPATLESVKGDFSRGTVRLQDGDYELRVEDGKFFITESYFEDRRQEHQIDYTLGNRRIQHYLTTLDDGRIVLLPPSWDVLEGEWFHNLEIAAPDQKEGIIAVQLWNKNCFSCHVSEEVKRFDPVDLSYATEWRDFGTSCERCHGPGGEHASHYAGVDFEKGEPKFIVTFAKLDHERRSMVCAQCHSFRDVMAFGYTAGKDYFDHFLPYLEYGQGPSRDPTWYVDGKTRRFSTNALGLWQSECFNEGKLDCLTCHVDVHEPEIEKQEQLLPTNNALCTGCHEEIGANLTTHTFRAAESKGSSCVECHMPRSVTSIKATMRDHSISVPVPENTEEFDIPNACNLCHDDRSPKWAIETLNRWYPGSTARDKVIRRASTYSAAKKKDPEALTELLQMASSERDPINRANAVGYLGNYEDSRVFAAIASALEDSHPLVRSMAALKIGTVDSADLEKARELAIGALADDKHTVRMNAAISLLNLGVSRLEGEPAPEFERAKRDHAVRGDFHKDDAAQQLNLGRFHVLNRDPLSATRAFEQSYRLNPDQPGIKYFMAVTRLSQKRVADARKFLKDVDMKDPFKKPAQELLAKLPKN